MTSACACLQCGVNVTAERLEAEYLPLARRPGGSVGRQISELDAMQVGQQTLVRSVPGELNTDKNEVLRLAQGRGCISKQILTEVRQQCNSITHSLSLQWA